MMWPRAHCWVDSEVLNQIKSKLSSGSKSYGSALSNETLMINGM